VDGVRKNLFYRNHEAAEYTAVICLLLASCKASQVNPKEWLADIIAWLPYYTEARENS
jgi:transposase